MAMDRVSTRWDLKILVTCLTLMWGCAPSCDSGNVDCFDCKPNKAQSLVERAKADLAAKRYAEAQQKCEKAEYLDPSNAEAPYCVLLANVGSLVQSLNSIVSLVATQTGAPAFRPSAINLKTILGAVLADTEGQIAYIDLYSYKLSQFENPTFQIDDFPLGMDSGDIVKLLNPAGDIKINGELSINLKGTWDISEVAVLGTAVNAAQGILDYLMAHNLVLDNTEIGTGSSGIAEFLANNQKLFAKDAGDTGRITGDEVHKGIQKDFLAALSYAVGREKDLELVAPANGGWIAAIQQSEANNAVDAVVRFKDSDSNGIPETIIIPALSDLKKSITGIDIQTEIDNPLPETAWKVVLKTAIALRNNIENGGAGVPLADALKSVADGLKDKEPNFRLLGKNVPNLIAVNPHAFLMKPKYLGELLPVYFTYTQNSTGDIHYALAWEEEIYTANGNVRQRLGIADSALPVNGDFSHFTFSVPDAVTSAVSVDAYTFPDKSDTPASFFLDADGIVATAKWPVLHVFAWSDASFGGLLELNSAWLANPAARSASFAPADAASFNKGINALIRAYCLNLSDLGDSAPLTDYFDDSSARYAENQIADCP